MRACLVAATILVLLAAPAARAQEDGDDAPPGPKLFAVEFGGGAVQLTGTDVQKIFSPTQPDGHLRGGIRLFRRMLDLGLGADFSQFTGWRIGQATGSASAEPSRLTLAPVSATALFRLELKKDQPVVPWIGGGYSYLYWNEENVLGNSTDPAQKNSVSGGKYGWTAQGGVQLFVGKFQAKDPDDDSGGELRDSFVNLEIAHEQYDYFGRHPVGLDLSHWTGRLSVGFEF